MTIFSVRYTYTDEPDQNASRDEHRSAHRAFLTELANDGTLMGSGPLMGETRPEALLVVSAGDPHEVAELLREDPFQQLGLVERVQIEEWNLILGPWAQPPA